MTTLIRCVLIGLSFVGPAALARAGSCGTVYYPPSYGYAKAYHDDYEVKKKLVVLEYVPLFAVGYAPPYTPPPAAAAPAPAVNQNVTVSPCEETARKLEAKIAALEARLGSAPPAELPVPKKATAPAAKGDGLAVLQSKCASCHTGAAAKKNGDGQPVVLFAEPGKLSPDADPVAILLAIEDDHMPPSKPLTAEEKKAVREFIRTATAKR